MSRSPSLLRMKIFKKNRPLSIKSLRKINFLLILTKFIEEPSFLDKLMEKLASLGEFLKYSFSREEILRKNSPLCVKNLRKNLFS